MIPKPHIMHIDYLSSAYIALYIIVYFSILTCFFINQLVGHFQLWISTLHFIIQIYIFFFNTIFFHCQHFGILIAHTLSRLLSNMKIVLF